ncbi:MAG TPA: c-type cytochrome [Leptospiraceae bacterium]|nr:c-type cytochrome [Leptospiraceae bacterium]HMY65812.1 c-type cytochrome [Leptospiraceae bacterium]HNF13341.1 c-type cytochrome [Leptospiraceae bacterium]HNM02833.1 c-type cytochrome [Leptospiraceae bacterium]HNN03512.1 c-type cytochrome [Leptospiraceae bacterium]
MSKKMKIILSVLAAILAVPILAVSYILTALPNIRLKPDIKAEANPERIERGKYLANHVTVCVDCHSVRDWTKFSGPISEGTHGKGGEVFDQKFGFPGAFYAANITQEKLKDWSDPELYRAVTSGVGKTGKAFFPVMPYRNYGKMDTEDILSIIAYIKTLPAIKNDVPKSQPDFPMNIILNTIPSPAEPVKAPDKNDKAAYGKYLVNAAACFDCHTNVNEKAEPLPGMDFAGGREFPMPWGTLRSSNITPDRESGIGSLAEADFVQKFKSHDPAKTPASPLKEGEMNTIMPWVMYSGMTEEDLQAIYSYLMTVKPVANKVTKFSAAKK